MANNGRDYDGEQAPWWAERRFITAAAVVAFIAVLGIAAAVIGVGGKRAPATSAATPQAAAKAPPTPTSSTGCSLPAGDQSVPTATPTGTQWTLVGTMAAPTSAVDGPQRSTGGLHTCFARSPLGALYAAVNFWAASTAQPNEIVLERLAADTPIKARLVRLAAQGKVGEAARAQTAGLKLQVAGFAVSSYTQDTASMSLAFRNHDGTLISLPTVMQWQNGDWRYVVAPSGGVPGGAQIPDLSGYLTWSGV